MAIDATLPSQIVSATAPATTDATKATGAVTTSTGLADNFQTFLTLLTTQLKNQNPLDPLDTNQFTQQLVQFAGVEQQLKSNEQLKSLIAIEKSAQATQALIYVGHTVAVDGSTQQFNGSATWNLKADRSATAALTITNSTGQTVYSGNFALDQGKASFVWDGKGNDGTQWPAGAYKLTATAKDASGKDVGIATEIQGVVDSVDLTSTPALLSIGGQNYTTDQIRRVIRPSASAA
jgi:flagellar basal-body rod modification protein FlgD